MADKTEEGNFLHLPRDAVERKSYHGGPPVARDRALAKQDEADGLALKGSLASPLADKTEQGNFLHLPRDAGERGRWSQPLQRDPDRGGRKALSEETGQRPDSGPTLADKTEGGNFVQIPRETSERKHYTRTGYTTETRKVAGEEEGRFDILHTNSLNENYTQRVKDAANKADGSAAPSPAQGMPGDAGAPSRDYMQAYKADSAAAVAKAAADRKASTEQVRAQAAENQKSLEKKKEDDLRGRATQLQTEIASWKSQSGSGTHDESAIAGAVDALTRELNAIPDHLKR